MAGVDNQNQRTQFRPFWEEALHDFSQPLSSFARKLAIGKTYDSQDLLQETNFRTLKYSPNPEKVKAPLSYLFRMMQNIAADWNKKINAPNMSSLDDPSGARALQAQLPPIQPKVLRTMENAGLLVELRIAASRLNKRERRLLAMRLQDYTWDEIAATLQESVGSVKTDWHRLLAKLRYHIKKMRAKAAGQGKP